MGQRNRFELKIEWRETAGTSENSTLKIELADTTETLTLNHPVVALFSELELGYSLNLTALTGTKPIANSSQTLSALFAGKLQGKVDKWFGLKGPHGKLVRVRLTLLLTRHPTHKENHSKGKDPKCPYLELLASGKQDNSGPIDSARKTRPEDSACVLKISIEPGTTGGLTEPSDFSLNRLPKLTGPQLKTALKSLCEEVSRLPTDQVQSARKELEDQILCRWALGSDSEKVTAVMRGQCFEQDAAILELLNAKKQLAEELQGEREKLRREETDLEAKQLQLCELQRRDLCWRLKQSKETDLVSVYRSLVQERNDFQLSARHMNQQNKKQWDDSTAQNARFSAELGEIQRENTELQGRIEELTTGNREINEQIQEIQGKVSSGTGDLRDCGPIEIPDSIEDSPTEGEIQCLLNDKETQKENLDNRYFQDLSFESGIYDSRRQLLGSICKQVVLEQYCCIRGDLLLLLDEIYDHENVRETTKQELCSGMHKAAEFLLGQCEKTHCQTQELGEMVDSADNLDTEIDALKDELAENQQRNPRYLPDDSDPIDCLMSKCINSVREPLTVKFLREAPGKYKFGTRTVLCRIEGEKLLLFKAGTSYVSFGEYIHLYLEKEMHKAGEGNTTFEHRSPE